MQEGRGDSLRACKIGVQAIGIHLSAAPSRSRAQAIGFEDKGDAATGRDLLHLAQGNGRKVVGINRRACVAAPVPTIDRCNNRGDRHQTRCNGQSGPHPHPTEYGCAAAKSVVAAPSADTASITHTRSIS